MTFLLPAMGTFCNVTFATKCYNMCVMVLRRSLANA